MVNVKEIEHANVLPTPIKRISSLIKQLLAVRGCGRTSFIPYQLRNNGSVLRASASRPPHTHPGCVFIIHHKLKRRVRCGLLV